MQIAQPQDNYKSDLSDKLKFFATLFNFVNIGFCSEK